MTMLVAGVVALHTSWAWKGVRAGLRLTGGQGLAEDHPGSGLPVNRSAWEPPAVAGGWETRGPYRLAS